MAQLEGIDRKLISPVHSHDKRGAYTIVPVTIPEVVDIDASANDVFYEGIPLANCACTILTAVAQLTLTEDKAAAATDEAVIGLAVVSGGTTTSIGVCTISGAASVAGDTRSFTTTKTAVGSADSICVYLKTKGSSATSANADSTWWVTLYLQQERSAT